MTTVSEETKTLVRKFIREDARIRFVVIDPKEEPMPPDGRLVSVHPTRNSAKGFCCRNLYPRAVIHNVDELLDESNERNDDDLPRTHDQRTQQPNT